MQFVGQKFHIFMIKFTFPIKNNQNDASCRGGEHNSAKRFLRHYIKHITFLPPKWPHKKPLGHLYSIFAPFMAAWSVQETVASAERADKNPLPTDHDQTCLNFVAIDDHLHQKCRLHTPIYICCGQLNFRLTCFQNSASCGCGEHNYAKRLRAVSINVFTFLNPKRPQKEHFCHLTCSYHSFDRSDRYFFASWALQNFASGSWLVHLVSRAPSAKTTACITPTCL